MDFGEALAALKGGKRVTRTGWNGKGQFVYLVPGSTFQVNRPPLLGIYPEGTVISYRPHLDLRTADGSCVPWQASQGDVMAEDWETVPDEPGVHVSVPVTVTGPAAGSAYSDPEFQRHLQEEVQEAVLRYGDDDGPAGAMASPWNPR